jgi:hypothetical protein
VLGGTDVFTTVVTGRVVPVVTVVSGILLEGKVSPGLGG